MQLKRVHVTNFRSVKDSTEFATDRVTCLIGKNEAGKTAVLQALDGLNPHHAESGYKYDRTRDYPRDRLQQYETLHPDNPAQVIWTEWELEDRERGLLETEFGKGSITKSALTVTKGYDSSKSYWTVPIDEAAALEHLIKQSKLDAAARNPIKGSMSSKSACQSLEALNQRTEGQQRLLDKIKSFRENDIHLKAIDIIKGCMPKFFYFSHYDRMSGEISINKLKDDKANGKNVSAEDEVFLDFLSYANTTLDEISNSETFEDLNSRCEAASNAITDKIFTYWRQNPELEIEVKFTEGRPKDAPPFNSGAVARARVKNNIHRVSVPFSERSAGFIWFFSFLVRFSQLKKKFGDVIILLDEPGLTLHGKAQQDLLDFIELELAPQHQVIYTTHSPFMVPADHIELVRTVEDVVERREGSRPIAHGTKVGSDFLVTNRDTMFPLQGALGYEATQSLFIGPNTLLVEGPSDILYLSALSRALKSRGREHLDPSWRICPAGGIDKIQPFLSLFSGNGINVCVLTDFADGQKSKIDKLKRSRILSEDKIRHFGEFVEQDEADVEDLFPVDSFAEIINRTYELPTKFKLDEKKLVEADATVRVVKKAEAYFRMLPAEHPEFDHFAPSEWLIRNPDFLMQDNSSLSTVLERAERIFAHFNRVSRE